MLSFVLFCFVFFSFVSEVLRVVLTEQRNNRCMSSVTFWRSAAPTDIFS